MVVRSSSMFCLAQITVWLILTAKVTTCKKGYANNKDFWTGRSFIQDDPKSLIINQENSDSHTVPESITGNDGSRQIPLIPIETLQPADLIVTDSQFGYVNAPLQVTDNVILETIHGSSDLVVNQLNRRCDVLENKLDKQYGIIDWVVNQPETSQYRLQPVERFGDNCTSGNNEILQEILFTLRNLSGLMNICHKDFMSQTSILIANHQSLTQNLETLQNELVPSFSQQSRLDNLEHRITHHEKKIEYLINGQQGVSNVHSDDQSFKSRVDSFITNMYEVTKSISESLNMMREQMNPTPSGGDHEQHLNTVIKTVTTRFSELVREQSANIERTIKLLHGNIENMITNQLRRFGVGLDKCCTTQNSSLANFKDSFVIKNKIQGISSDVGKILVMLRGVCNITNNGHATSKDPSFKIKQSEWEAMMMSLRRAYAKTGILFGDYKKALDARACPVFGKPHLGENIYKITKKPLKVSN